MLWVSFAMLFLNAILLTIAVNYYVLWKAKCNEKPLRDSKGRFCKKIK